MSFTEDQLTRIHEILATPGSRGDSGKTNAEHATHCLEQIIRISGMFARELVTSDDVRRRDGQICTNYGRLQEILEGIGGMDRWWNAFHPLWTEKNWAGLIAITFVYAHCFGLELDPEKVV